ncbi:MAG: hypothetical protein RL235_848 [Chlamydiota bacterium]|jgi:lipoate-protein ligase A
MKTLHWIELKGVSIFEQLQIEEALLRADERNVCIVNQGSPRAIVMGQTAEPESVIHMDKARAEQIPMYHRYSGGGTVIVDSSTLFVTLIMNHDALDVSPFPEPILRWTCALYQQAWQIPGFGLRENDYAIGDRKCGGNAQYLRKNRWAHHTSFLYDFNPNNMDFLKLPQKRPVYRKDRGHDAFLCRLKDHGLTMASMASALKGELVKQFYIEDSKLLDVRQIAHRRSTHQLCS